jgi:hypothetical protein
LLKQPFQVSQQVGAEEEEERPFDTDIKQHAPEQPSGVLLAEVMNNFHISLILFLDKSKNLFPACQVFLHDPCIPLLLPSTLLSSRAPF